MSKRKSSKMRYESDFAVASFLGHQVRKINNLNEKLAEYQVVEFCSRDRPVGQLMELRYAVVTLTESVNDLLEMLGVEDEDEYPYP